MAAATSRAVAIAIVFCLMINAAARLGEAAAVEHTFVVSLFHCLNFIN
jgi:hypothetical protein